MQQFFKSTLLTSFTLLKKKKKNAEEKQKSYVKNKLEKGYKFLVENNCYDNYCRLIWTINS